MNNGWICSYRKIWDHPLFKGCAWRVGVWDWMLKTAAWKETKQNVNGKIVAVQRGQFVASYSQIAAKTGVGIQSIRTFLRQLEGEQQINTDTNTGRLRVTICNYNYYQSRSDIGNTTENTQLTRDQHVKEQDNKIDTLEPNGSKDAGASETIQVSVLTSALWTAGLQYLKSKNIAESKARSMIGRWRKQSTDADILKAIEASQKSGTEDPFPYITAALKGDQATDAGADYRKRLERFQQRYGGEH